jgi:hypothetical protein
VCTECRAECDSVKGAFLGEKDFNFNIIKIHGRTIKISNILVFRVNIVALGTQQ